MPADKLGGPLSDRRPGAPGLGALAEASGDKADSPGKGTAGAATPTKGPTKEDTFTDQGDTFTDQGDTFTHQVLLQELY